MKFGLMFSNFARDIDGRLRARWNTALLRDVVAPCYSRALALAAAAALDTPTKASDTALPQAWAAGRCAGLLSSYYSLFPTKTCPAPWSTVSLYFVIAFCV